MAESKNITRYTDADLVEFKAIIENKLSEAMSDLELLKNTMSGKDIINLFNDNKLTAITFSTADASFAIPLEQVLYIEKDVKRNLQVDALEEFNHGVITFQNNFEQFPTFFSHPPQFFFGTQDRRDGN